MIHKVDDGPELVRHKWELRLLDRRMSIINAALFLAVSSAVMACIVIAVLFIANIGNSISAPGSHSPSSCRCAC